VEDGHVGTLHDFGVTTTTGQVNLFAAAALRYVVKPVGATNAKRV